MAGDEEIGTFCAFTSATPEQAARYLALTDDNVEQAVELFFSNPDLAAAPAPASAPAPQLPHIPSTRNAPITIDDDDDDDDMDDFGDDDVQETGSRPIAPASGPSVDDDEAMARRLQEEMYGGGGASRGAGGMDVDGEGVRAPMARTTETLIGPGSHDWRTEPGEMNAAIAQQLMNRQQRRAQPGIFNQRPASSIWNDDATNPEAHRQALSRATAGASDQTSKANLLADLFRPPFDLISHIPWSAARDEGKENEKWIIVNVQDPSIFDCQILNRDIWKNQSIHETVKEHFIFLQYNKDDPRGQEYINYYFSAMRDSDDAYPHIAIVDPRTGEQVKVWSGSPSPKPADFLMDLHEFLDRYSLSMAKKNPVQTKRKESKKDVGQMSEEEMLEMALQNSLANGAGPKDDDPDALTKPGDNVNGKGKAPAGEAMEVDAEAASTVARNTPFSRISSTNSHEEPSATDKQATRIQIRHSGGRVIRRFGLSDPVRRIYEWLKASPVEGKEGAAFELISMGKNLIDSLDMTVEEAGLKNGTVMVEFIEDE